MPRAAQLRSRSPRAAASPGRRERNKRDKRRRILAAARALFATKGFGATTTQEIAARAAVGTGTLFLYVQSKEEVLVLVFRDQMDRVAAAAFASAPSGPLLAQLMHVYGALVRFHDQDPDLARVFVKEVMFVSDANREVIEAFVSGVLLDRSAALVEAAQARGELAADVPPRLLAQNCFAAFIHLLQKWLGRREPLATPDHLAHLRASFALQLRGLAPADAPRPPARRRARTPKGTPR